MLDDLPFIPKARFALLGKEVFYDKLGMINLYTVRSFVYGLSSTWKLFLIGLQKDTQELTELKQELDNFGVTITKVYIVNAVWKNADIQRLVNLCDVVYAPCLQTLPVKFYPKFRSPRDSKQTVDLITHFSGSLEPFNQDNYYSFLNRT